ncbi:MAG: hypothetical protein WC124_15175, partial [Desulfoplanes sp.]
MNAAKYRFSVFDVVIVLFTFFFILLFLFPVYIAVLTALKSPLELAQSILAFPKQVYWDNFREGLAKSNFLRSLLNSVLVTFPSVVGIVIVSSMGGYAICRYGKRYWDIGKMEKVFLASLMLPFQILMIPVYRMFRTLGMLNTRWGAILFEIGYSTAYAT